MNWTTFLDRIGATGTEANLETLVDLQRLALLSLPFENLDIHLGRPINLDLEAVFRKIVADGRGGFCYELNECFLHCLAARGYEVERMEGRVELGGAGAPFDHQWTLVHLEGNRWMADIGMGDSSLSPLNLDDPEPQTDGRSWFRVNECGGGFEIFRQLQPDEWSKMLTLNLAPQPWERFSERCHWQQTSPDSAFVRKRMCTRATPSGRISLIGNTLRINGKDTSETLIAEAEYTAVLQERFGIRLTSPNWRRPL